MANRDPNGPQASLFGDLDQVHWKGLPSYEQRDQSPHHSILLHFSNDEEIAEFHRVTGIPRTKHRSFWFRQPENVVQSDKVWIDDDTAREIGMIEAIEAEAVEMELEEDLPPSQEAVHEPELPLMDEAPAQPAEPEVDDGQLF